MSPRILTAAAILALGITMPLAAATYYVSADGIAPDGSTTAFTKVVDAYAAAVSDTVESVVLIMPGLLAEQGSLLLSSPLVTVKGEGAEWGQVFMALT